MCFILHYYWWWSLNPSFPLFSLRCVQPVLDTVHCFMSTSSVDTLHLCHDCVNNIFIMCKLETYLNQFWLLNSWWSAFDLLNNIFFNYAWKSLVAIMSICRREWHFARVCFCWIFCLFVFVCVLFAVVTNTVRFDMHIVLVQPKNTQFPLAWMLL